MPHGIGNQLRLAAWKVHVHRATGHVAVLNQLADASADHSVRGNELNVLLIIRSFALSSIGYLPRRNLAM